MVRAIEERFYGRVGRTIIIGEGPLPYGSLPAGFLTIAQAEARPMVPGQMHSTLRHARIPEERATEFFARVVEIAEEFITLPREGDEVFGFVTAVYRTDHPTLPERDDR